jgi:hypothetical protein
MSDTKIKSSNIGNLAVTHDKLHTTMDLTAKTVTIATPTANTHPATKLYVDTEVANLIDSAPGTLDTLNELAAAVNDDANFNATIASSIATKLPLAGGTMTGNLDLGTNKVLFSNVYATVGDLPSASSYHGMFAHVHGTGKGYYAHAGAWIELVNNNFAGHFLPSANITYDLGSASMRWRDLYLDGNTIDLGGVSISSSTADNSISAPVVKATSSMKIGDSIIDTDGSGKMRLPADAKIGSSNSELPAINTTIQPEVLEIQVSANGAGVSPPWTWTWLTSSLPYSRRAIVEQKQVTVPIYLQGTYTINNFAGAQTYGAMDQTHNLHLKWIEGAGTQNNITQWVTTTTTTATNSNINSGASTQVERHIVNVPSTITIPTLVAPTVTYNVTAALGKYVLTGGVSGTAPNIGPLRRGGTYTFANTEANHPIYITTDNGQNWVAGQYVGEYLSGVTNSRAGNGNLVFTVPADAPDLLYYACGNHLNMGGEISVKDLAVETNVDGNYVVYGQHTQEGHKQAIELRPIPQLVDQMCLVYDGTASQWVPQDLATYVDNTPSFANKIREVAGTAELVVADGAAVIAKVNVYNDNTYLPLSGNNAGDQAFAADINTLFVWDGTTWETTKHRALSQIEDVNLDVAATDGQALTWDHSNGYWKAVTPFSQSNFDTALSGKTTANLTEGSNLYHTTERTRAAISATGGHVTYNTGTGVITHADTSTLSGAQTAASGSVINSVTVDTVGHVTATATSDTIDKANKWTTARTLTLTGEATGSATFDGSGNITMAIDVVGGGSTIGGTVENANTLDSLDSTYFLNASNMSTGTLPASRLPSTAVKTDVAQAITAAHNLSSASLTMSSHYYSNMYSGSNVYQHIYPSGGNGSTSTTLHTRVWDGPAGDVKVFTINGDGETHWDAGTIHSRFIGRVDNTTGSGSTNKTFSFSDDYSSFMIDVDNQVTPQWGLFWAGNTGAAFGTNGTGGPGNIWGNSTNPNEFTFVGSGSTKWTVGANNGNTWQAGTLTAVGNITSGGDVVSNSDVRLKSHIKPLEHALDIVKNLHGKAYIKDDRANIGLIAQEVEEVLPMMVHTANDEMGTKSVNYQNMVAILIEAIKDQQNQIDELKEIISGSV